MSNTSRRNPGSTVPSPCVSICVLNEEDICTGCWRTAQEISFWGTKTDEERWEIIKLCVARGKKNNPFA